MARVTIALSCGSKAYDNAESLTAAVRAFFRSTQLPVPMNPYTILGCWIGESRDEDSAEVGVYESVVNVGMEIVIAA